MAEKPTVVPTAHLGAPRKHSGGAVTRVELRLPSPLAARLYHIAEARGQSVSRVGADALKRGLDGVE